MKFEYQGFDVSGQSVAATIEAPSSADATELLRRQGTFVTQMSEAGIGGGGNIPSCPSHGREAQALGDV